MEPTDMSTTILIEIRDEMRGMRDEVRGTNARLDDTNARLGDTIVRLDGTNTRLDSVNARLDRVERRQVESEIRLATELVAVAGAVREVRDVLQHGSLAAKVADHEARITRIEETREKR